MRVIYVLNETEQDGSVTTLGVFDDPNITDATLRKYYGKSFMVTCYQDIRDSALEWQKRIMVDGVAGVLTLHYFYINEL